MILKSNNRFFLIILFLLFGAFVFQSSCLFNQTSPIRFLFISIILGLLVIISKDVLFPKNNSILLLFIFLLIQCSSYFYAVNKVLIFPEIQKTIFLIIAIIYIPPYLKKHPNTKYVLLKSLLIVNIVWNIFGFYDFIIYANNFQLPEKESYLIGSLLGNKNFYASALLMLTPFCAISFLKYDRIWKFLSFILFFANGLMIVLLRTRSIWIASIILVLIFIIFIIHFRVKNKTDFIHSCKKNKIWIVLFIINGLLIISVQFLANQKNSIQKDISVTSISNSSEINSVTERFFLWNNSFKMIKIYPLLGVGCGNWPIQINKQGLTGSAAAYGNVNFVQPHNDYLKIFCENGIIGFIVFGAFFCIILFEIIVTILKSESIEMEKLMFLLGIIGFLIYAFFEFPYSRPEHFFLLVIYICLASNFSSKNVILKQKTILFKLVFPFIFIIFLNAIYVIRCEYYISEANKLRFSEKWQKSLFNLNKINTSFYNSDMTLTPVNWYKGIAYYNMQNYMQANLYLKKAYLEFPYNLNVINNLGSSFAQIGNYEKAKELYNETLNISNEFDDARINLAILLYNEGRLEECFAELKKLSNPEIIKLNLNFVSDILNQITKKKLTSVDEVVNFLQNM